MTKGKEDFSAARRNDKERVEMAKGSGGIFLDPSTSLRTASPDFSLRSK
jgi:hypothetical protein